MKKIISASTICVAILTFCFMSVKAPTKAYSNPEAGTCCYQRIAVCVIGEHVIAKYYHRATGPCPEKKAGISS